MNKKVFLKQLNKYADEFSDKVFEHSSTCDAHINFNSYIEDFYKFIKTGKMPWEK